MWVHLLSLLLPGYDGDVTDILCLPLEFPTVMDVGRPSWVRDQWESMTTGLASSKGSLFLGLIGAQMGGGGSVLCPLSSAQEPPRFQISTRRHKEALRKQPVGSQPIHILPSLGNGELVNR